MNPTLNLKSFEAEEPCVSSVLIYGVIGNTSDFGSEILGSSPSRSTNTNKNLMKKILLFLILLISTNYCFSQLKYKKVDIEIGISSTIQSPHFSMFTIGSSYNNLYLEFQTNIFTKNFGDSVLINMNAFNIGGIVPVYQSNNFIYSFTPKIGVWAIDPTTYLCGGLNFSITYKYIKLSLITTFVQDYTLLGLGIGFSI